VTHSSVVPDIAVVIPTYQRIDVLPGLVASLAAQTIDPARFEVVLVDDCSDVPLADALSEIGEQPFTLRLLRTTTNSGPATARNVGWQSTAAPLLAFIDDDCTPEPEWLERGLAAMEADPKVGVMQARTVPPHGVSLYGRDDWWVWRVVEQAEPEFMACNIFYRREAFETTGGFDEEIGWWGEDTSAGWRVLDAGWQRGYCNDAVVSHPVERRGWRFFVRNGWNESNMVSLAVQHPGYRAEKYWKPWAYRPDGPELLLALVGFSLARRHRIALLLAVPYLWRRRPSVRHLSFFRLCLQVPAVDIARLAGHLRGSIKHRTLVL
jgi:GT2 family glycosyltransferase